MGTPILPVPAKDCETCGQPMERKRYGKQLEDRTRFMQRRHCSQACANSRRAVVKDTLHWRAGATDRLHVHHLDRNPANNDPTNLVTLCASCHLRLHWREDRPQRMEAARKAAATAASRGVNTRPRSADGRWSSAG